MQNKIKILRKYNRTDNKYITDIQQIYYNIEDEQPPTELIDIVKLPNGQFKDRRYLHTDESFFVKMGGKNREFITQKLKAINTKFIYTRDVNFYKIIQRRVMKGYSQSPKQSPLRISEIKQLPRVSSVKR